MLKSAVMRYIAKQVTLFNDVLRALFNLDLDVVAVHKFFQVSLRVRRVQKLCNHREHQRDAHGTHQCLKKNKETDYSVL